MDLEDVLSPEKVESDVVYEESIRPRSLEDFVGQDRIKENLKVFIESAKRRGSVLDHILISGPPGLGKTTIAKIISNEMNSNFVYTVSNTFQKVGDLVAVLTNLQKGDILFIDEIHRLRPMFEEVLYSAMEDFSVSIMIGEGPGAKSIKIKLPEFTLIGATTKVGLLTSPLLSRFGIVFRFDYYSVEELKEICFRTARILGISLSSESAEEISRRSRGTPRILNRIIRRVRDFAIVSGVKEISKEFVDDILNRLSIDSEGLDEVDRKILLTLIEKYEGGPVGLKTIAASIGEEEDTIEDVYEPFLIMKGFIKRTPKGRVATELAYRHMNVTKKHDGTLFW